MWLLAASCRLSVGFRQPTTTTPLPMSRCQPPRASSQPLPALQPSPAPPPTPPTPREPKTPPNARSTAFARAFRSRHVEQVCRVSKPYRPVPHVESGRLGRMLWTEHLAGSLALGGWEGSVGARDSAARRAGAGMRLGVVGSVTWVGVLWW